MNSSFFHNRSIAKLILPLLLPAVLHCSGKGKRSGEAAVAISDRGREVILKDDGSWCYSDIEQNETIIMGSEKVEVGRGIPARATRFKDGDTFDIRVDGNYPGIQREETVRLIGVDAPELSGNNGNEYYSAEALDYIRERLSEEALFLFFDDTRKRDSFCRLLAYTCLSDGTCLNAEMLEKGYARLFTGAEDRFYSNFLELQKAAIENGRGVWGRNPGGVFILYIYNHGREEYLLLKNGSAEEIDISGWYIEDRHGDRLDIPGSTVINNGELLKLCSGETGCENSNYKLETRTVWNNSSDTAFLYDSEGILRDTYRY